MEDLNISAQINSSPLPPKCKLTTTLSFAFDQLFSNIINFKKKKYSQFAV